MKELSPGHGPGNFATRRWSWIGALLALMLLAQGGVRASELRSRTENSNGIRLKWASVPTFTSGRPPGSWALMRLHFDVQSPAPNVQVTVSLDRVGSWSTTANLTKGNDEADIAIPSKCLTEFWSPDDSGYQRLQLHFRASAEGRITSGTFSTGVPRISDSNGPYDEAAFLNIGVEGPGRTFQSFSPDDIEGMAAHSECLDRIRAITVDERYHDAQWLSLPGLRQWVDSGGVLIEMVDSSGVEKWTNQGAGLVVNYPGELTREVVDRMILAARGSTANVSENTTPAQRDWPGFRAPLVPIMIVLAIYFVLLVPVNYLVLERMRRKELLWITGPVIAGTFCFVMAGICYAYKGGASTAARVAVVEELSPGSYFGFGHFSIFSPRSARYRVELPAGTLAEKDSADEDRYRRGGAFGAGSESISFTQGDRSAVQELPVLQWCSNAVGYHFTPQITGAITGTASYNKASGWTVSVQNHSSLDLKDCRVWTETGWQFLSDLPSGGSILGSNRTTFPLNMPPGTSSGYPGPTGYPSSPVYSPGGTERSSQFHPDTPPGKPTSFEHKIRNDEFYAVEQTHSSSRQQPGIYFIGWTTQPVQPGSAAGVAKYLDETMVLVPLTIVPDAAGLNVPSTTVELSSLSSKFMYMAPGKPAPEAPAYVAVRLPSSVLSHPECKLKLSLYLTLSEMATMSVPTESDSGGYPPPAGYPGGSYPRTYPPSSYPGSYTSTDASPKSLTANKKLTISVWNTIQKTWIVLPRKDYGNKFLIDLSSLGNYAAAPVGVDPDSDVLVYLKCECPQKEISFGNIQASLNDSSAATIAGGHNHD